MFKIYSIAILAFILGLVVENGSQASFSGPPPQSNRSASEQDAKLAVSKEEKQKLWETKEKEVDGISDRLGMPIDPKIKRTIIVLNLLGIETIQSCEGHMNGHSDYPWVSIEDRTVATEAVQAEINSKSGERGRLYELISSKHPGLSFEEIEKLEDDQEELMPKYRKASEEIMELALNRNSLQKDQLQKCLIPLQRLLRRFYSKGIRSYGCMLITHFNELRCVDSEYLDASHTEGRLQEHQEEMSAFTDFLVDVYFNE